MTGGVEDLAALFQDMEDSLTFATPQSGSLNDPIHKNISKSDEEREKMAWRGSRGAGSDEKWGGSELFAKCGRDVSSRDRVSKIQSLR